jgi:anti-sigma factor RsiW
MSGSALIRMPFGPVPDGYRGPLIRLAPGSHGDGGLLINTGATDSQLETLPVWDGGRWLSMWRFAVVALTAAAMFSVAVPALGLLPQAVAGALLPLLAACHLVARRAWLGRHALALEMLAPVLVASPFSGQGRRSLGGSLVRYFSGQEEATGTDERQLRFEIAHYMRAFAEVYGTPYEAAGFDALLRAEAALKDLSALGEPLEAPATAVPERALV